MRGGRGGPFVDGPRHGDRFGPRSGRGEFADPEQLDDGEGFGRFGGRGPGGPGRRRQRGQVRVALLAALRDGPGHGYDLMNRLQARTDGAWRPSAGSIYPTLQQLDDEGLVTSIESDGKRVYAIAAAGTAELERLEQAGDGPRWNAGGNGVHPGQLFRALRGLELAAKQVLLAGGQQQLASAIAVVSAARTELYRQLAEADLDGTSSAAQPGHDADGTASDEPVR